MTADVGFPEFSISGNRANEKYEQAMILLKMYTHVYIDTKTCNSLLLERFLTYILNYPPVKGLQSVQILYQGTLDDLGDHLKNALQNTLPHIQQFQ